MKIEQLDKNFAIVSRGSGEDKKEYKIPSAPLSLYGVYFNDEKKRFERMPESVTENVSVGVASLAKNTAGGRLRFSTDSTTLEIEVKFPDLCRFSHMPLSGTSGFALVEEDGKSAYYVKGFWPSWNCRDGYSGSIALRGGMRSYTLYFPLYNDVTDLSLFFDKDAVVEEGAPYRDVKPILYYGSSITQGGCASRADTCYQALISKWNNIDFINLGFSGNAKGEVAMAEYLAGIDCSLFVCDYDHNAPSVEHLAKTHYRLYETFRKSNPITPILFVTRPDYDYSADGEGRRLEILKTYKRAKRSGDGNVYFLDGRRFYGKGDRTLFAVDGCHPTDHGFYRMAKEIYAKMIKINPLFK